MLDLYILAIDTSCDDTSVAVLKNDCLLSSVVSSQIAAHKEWGGVVPMIARREHERLLPEGVKLALKRAGLKENQITAIAVTYGPGLAPALEIGVNLVKEMALRLKIPIIPVNHMEGHLLSPLLKNKHGKYFQKNISEINFPALSLCVSGGHTEIVKVEEIGKYKIIGQTLDDAAGEALDKIARMLDLGYPGGPVIEYLSKKGDRNKYMLPRPMSTMDNYSFSFSGLKTACLYQIKKLKVELGSDFYKIIPDYCASVEEAVVDSLLIKFRKACLAEKPKIALISGGVSINRRLRNKFYQAFKKIGLPLYLPNKKFCGDNAAMIGIAGYYQYLRGEILEGESINSLDRNPSLRIGE